MKRRKMTSFVLAVFLALTSVIPAENTRAAEAAGEQEAAFTDGWPEETTESVRLEI